MRERLKTSGVGVITAEMMVITSTAYRRLRASHVRLTAPIRPNRIIASGSSNRMPNPNTNTRQKLTNFSTDMSGSM